MSISPIQILIILFVILIFFGPSRLPGLGKSMGKAIRGFKKGISTDDEDDQRDVTNSQLEDGNDAKVKSDSKEKEEA